jgi:hypothetical protein
VGEQAGRPTRDLTKVLPISFRNSISKVLVIAQMVNKGYLQNYKHIYHLASNFMFVASVIETQN